jgi:hypothetical protein
MNLFRRSTAEHRADIMNRLLRLGVFLTALALGSTPARTQSPSPGVVSPPAASLPNIEGHSASIHGIRVGMTAQEVLNILGRMPDTRKDEKGEIIVGWKAIDGFIQVRFRKDAVSYVGLQFRPLRPTNDFELVAHGEATASEDGARLKQQVDTTGIGPQFEVGSTVAIGGTVQRAPTLSSGKPPSALTGRDPLLHPEYRVGETGDREHLVWTRVEQEPQVPYRVEIGFISADKKQLGSLFDTKVEFKYVTVLREDLKKFDNSTSEKIK